MSFDEYCLKFKAETHMSEQQPLSAARGRHRARESQENHEAAQVNSLLRVPSHPEKAKEIFPKGRFKKQVAGWRRRQPS
jgi:hypothetical protein